MRLFALLRGYSGAYSRRVNDDPFNRQGDNQPSSRVADDAFADDAALREAVAREGGAWAEAQLHAYGALAAGELLALGLQANANRRFSGRSTRTVVASIAWNSIPPGTG